MGVLMECLICWHGIPQHLIILRQHLIADNEKEWAGDNRVPRMYYLCNYSDIADLIEPWNDYEDTDKAPIKGHHSAWMACLLPE